MKHAHILIFNSPCHGRPVFLVAGMACIYPLYWQGLPCPECEATYEVEVISPEDSWSIKFDSDDERFADRSDSCHFWALGEIGEWRVREAAQ